MSTRQFLQSTQRTFFRLRKRAGSAVAQRGVAYVELAFSMALVLTVIFAAAYLYRYLRVYQAVRAAAVRGAEIAATLDPALLDWLPTAATPERPELYYDSDVCRASGASCVTAAAAQGRVQALSWQTPSLAGVSSVHALPFELYEAPTDPAGYFPVQVLPTIGIERGCWEVFNETASRIPTSPKRGYGMAAAAYCQHVKPLYWQSPQRADFDGDGKEDLVFFKPRGSSTSWGANVPDTEVDFIVLQSGAGYSSRAGFASFSLSTERAMTDAPYALPIVADYDRDGMADYAVFEPESGFYRIAFSSVGYRVIGEGYAGILDPMGERGLVAVPGAFRVKGELEIAVMATAAANAADRYDLYFASVSANVSQADLRAVLAAGGTTLTLPSGTNYTKSRSAAQQAMLKPHVGTVAVPAFADYDDDGIDELGFASWYGGNLTQKVLGRVRSAANNFAAQPLFETTDTPAGSAADLRIHPFESVVDRFGNLYLSDAVDHRIWKISASENARGTFSTSNATTLFPSHARVAARSSVAGFNPEASFPRENLWNVPPNDTRVLSDALAENQQQAVSGRVLKYPRRIVIANGLDEAMYVADWGNARILRVEGGTNGPTPASASRVVLGGISCVTGSCAALQNAQSPGSSNTWQARNGLYRIFPSALAIVPDASNASRYFLAFSTEYAIYIVTHTRSSGGPRGESGEIIYKIAGLRGTAPANVTGFNATGMFYLPNAIAHRARICAISDMAFDTSTRSIFAASSCSLRITPTANPNLQRSVGGIFQLRANSAAQNFTNSNTLSVLAGTFLAYPCVTPGRCARPNALGAGVFQRKLDLNATINQIDIMNPVDLTLGANGRLLFSNQWNTTTNTNANNGGSGLTGPYPLAPGRTDHQQQQGIYELDLASNRVLPLTNPYSFGSETLPLQSADWHAPQRFGSSSPVIRWIEAHEAPLKNVPLAARGTHAIFGDNLYVTSPYLSNSTTFTVGHPLRADPMDMGVVHRVRLDQDGDGVGDSTDSDIDGDARPNTTETGVRSPICAEIFGPSVGGCRMQERAGLPRVYFFKADPAARLDLPVAFGAPASATYGEYLLLNSVSECGPTASCRPTTPTGYAGALGYPEAWASLFNYGDDLDFSATESICALRASDNQSAYAQCPRSASGLIVRPAPLHTFVGASTAPPSATQALPGAGYTRETTLAAQGSSRAADANLLLFPFLSASVMPRENGLKPVRRIALDSSKNPRVLKSGVLCWDYRPEVVATAVTGTATTAAAAGRAFGAAFSSNLSSYLYSGMRRSEDYFSNQGDNDAFNYLTECATAATFPDSRVPAMEGVVLQLDHDDTNNKEAGLGADPHWPHASVVGNQTLPENQRIFLTIDLDGDGMRDPTWLSVDSFVGAGRTLNTGGAYTLSSGSLAPIEPGLGRDLSLAYMREMRSPFSDIALLGTLSWLPPGEFKAPLHLLENPALNFAFDRGRKAAGRGSALFAALNFSPYVARALQVASRSDTGAGMYQNYLSTNRFRIVAGREPPGIIAAQNALKISLGTTQFVSSPSALELEKAFVTFLADDGSECTQYTTSADTKDCAQLLVAYQINFLGQTITVRSSKPVVLPASQQTKCDPASVGGC